MNSLNTKNKLKAAFIVASAAALAVGCSSTKHHQASYSANQAPLAMTEQSGESMGGTGASTEIQTGGGSSQMAATQTGENIVIPLQQEQLKVGTQKVDAGNVRLRKTVTTETVYQPVQVRREQLSLERLPAGAQPSGAANQGAAPQFSGSQSGGAQASSGQAAGSLGAPFQEGEMTINLSKEQAVAQTEIVPAGSVVVHKQTVTEPVNVQRQVRRENVEAITTPGSTLISPAPEASGAAPSAQGQSSGAGASSGITQLNQLSGASDKSSLAGQPVNLSSAKVQQVVGDRLIVLAAPDGTSIYVRTAQPAKSLSPGQKVALNGTVRQVPQSGGASSMGLDERSSQALQGQEIFIDANSVTISPQ
jgi:stress response protein YsnF